MVELLPGSPEALSNLGAAYKAAGMAEQAVEHFRRAATARPGDVELLYNLGNGLIAAGRLEEAERLLRDVVAADPAHVRARTNLGVALNDQGRLDEAIETCRDVIALAPENADAHWNLSLALVMAGRYEEGWREYEWRRRIPDFAIRPIEGRGWDGSAYAGKTLLVHAEQGLGDSIQFARYLPEAARRGGSLVFVCQQPLKPLLGAARDGFDVRGDKESLPSFDVQAPLMSLPHLLGIAMPLWPEHGPYLHAQSERMDLWAERLHRESAMNVGICWQGRPDYKADKRRSVPLSALAPLADLDGVRLIGLQKGHGAEQLEEQAWRDRVLETGPEIDADGAFMDTAAIIAALDLVITSDTAMAHLAGALGARVWMLLAHVPDWRWGIDGTTTPWYPTMRLFRQKRPGDWVGVIAEVIEQLEALENA